VTKLTADDWFYFSNTLSVEQVSEVTTVRRALLRIQGIKVQKVPQDDQVGNVYEVTLHVKCHKYIRPPNIRTNGNVCWPCRLLPLVGHVKYAPRAILFCY